MRKRLAAAFAVSAALGVAALGGAAQAGDLYGPLDALSFMEGDWTSVANQKGDLGGGVSSIHADLHGRLLQRRDHLVMNGGGTMDIWMPIWAEDGQLKALFIASLGIPPIHYVVTPGPGPSAVFDSPSPGVVPGFRLTYTQTAPDRLHVRFEIAQPGKPYETYVEGDLARDATH